MSDVATAEQAREPVEDAGDTLSALVTMTRSRTGGARATHVAVILLADLVRASGAGKRWMNSSRRRIAKALRLSEWDVRVGFADLARWGWIEKRPCAERAGAHYRLSTAFAEAAEAAGEKVSRVLQEYLPMRCSPDELRAHATPTSPKIFESLRACTWQRLMQRLVKLNERPKRHRGGYSKTVLRATAVMLHWFIQVALRDGEPLVTSLRGLARETGLTFRSARRTRARLIAWGLLAERDGAFALDYMRLAQWLFEEGVELPPAPAIHHRRRGRHHDHGRSA